MRFDPFREMDQLFRRGFDSGRFFAIPLDAYRRGDEFIAEFELPGIDPESIDVTVERNVLEVTAQRAANYQPGDQVLVAERPTGQVSRQLFLGEGLATDRISASYDDGILTVTIPVAEEARPHKVQISAGSGAKEVAATSS